MNSIFIKTEINDCWVVDHIAKRINKKVLDDYNNDTDIIKVFVLTDHTTLPTIHNMISKNYGGDKNCILLDLTIDFKGIESITHVLIYKGFKVYKSTEALIEYINSI